ncbi:uncharacterized protein [Solanum lycopersicum]|uniref:uncharacterized protein n=1 Tax=Solanum lycopersicum TaxID=4081 RepID=UPI003748BF65
MVPNPRDRMNKFVIRVSRLVEKEDRTTMLLNDMDISRIMVYVQQIEESKIREIRQEGTRPKSDDSSNQRPKKRFYPKYTSIGNKDRAPNQHSQGRGHSYERGRCPTCGKQQWGKCLAVTDGCFACGLKVHNMRDFSNLKSRGKYINQVSLDPNAPKKNSFYIMGATNDN